MKLVLLCILSLVKSQGGNPDGEMESPFQALQQKIYGYAKELSRQKEDPTVRKLKQGLLPSYFPKSQREAAEKMRAERKKSGELMRLIDSVYRFCVYPTNEVSAFSYCSQTFDSISKKRGLDCKHAMCINCCNHLLLVMKYTASRSVVSQSLGLSDDSGFNQMKKVVSNDIIMECRKTCDVTYVVEKPIVIPPPPKDPTLGLTLEKPATSCIDIQLNSVEAKSGVYYVTPGTSTEPIKVYCDLENDQGGWTLFFSYNHKPYEDYQLDSSNMPTDPLKSKSHMNLEEAGFQEIDVNELRFVCFTKAKPDQTLFIHFKTRNPNALKLAMNGDQSNTNLNTWLRDNQQFDKAPEVEGFNKNLEAVMSIPKKAQSFGQNPQGGFWDNPFSNQDAAWQVKGKQKIGGKWECGTKLTSQNGGKYETLHQIYFRGTPPTKEFLEKRAIKFAKIDKLAKEKKL